jgi:broad specificity phosphatase PhoE
VATLILLRHGEVASHRGDVPVTEAGLVHAEGSGKALASAFDAPFTLLFGGTRRTRETAAALATGMDAPDRVAGPLDSFALRNPDLYVAGTRVDMVSSAATLAEQVPGMTEEQASRHGWFADFFKAPDRIGWWLSHLDPPGDRADDVAARISHFALSLDDDGPTQRRIVIGVTHSPVLRSVLQAGTGSDPGEPAYLTGALLTIATGGTTRIEPFDPHA